MDEVDMTMLDVEDVHHPAGHSFCSVAAIQQRSAQCVQ